MEHAFFESVTTEQDGLRVSLAVQPAINHALVHNRVPLVRSLAVSNLTPGVAGELTVRLDLSGHDGPLAPTWTRTVRDHPLPGQEIRWDDFGDFVPDGRHLRHNEESYPVDFQLSISRPDRPDVGMRVPSAILAHNEWFNAPALYDSLAAFVQPNTRAVDEVLRAAAGILTERTGSGSLQGYQAGPQRAAQIAGAVYEALRQRHIHYQTLAPSFERTGQKVRTTAEVLTGGLANCVDLSVTYAACLEAAGLNPLVWLTDDHAFAGFLIRDVRLPGAVVTEANYLRSLVDSGGAVPVELTGIGPGTDVVDFTRAVSIATGYLRDPSRILRGAIDVGLAHRTGIKPLPSVDDVAAAGRLPAGDSTPSGSLDLPQGLARTLDLSLLADSDEAPVQVDDSPPRIQRWKRSLLDLSLRNPLLNLPRRGRGVDLYVPPGSLAALDDLIHDGRPVHLVAQDLLGGVHRLSGARRVHDLDAASVDRELRRDRRLYVEVTGERYVTVMRRMQREARTMEQETGSNYLYLTLGTLVHSKASGDEAHAPLFLLPVRIEGGAGRRPYHLIVDGPEIASPNYCLIEWLRAKHGLSIPELSNPARDEHGIDIPATMAAISARLVDGDLDYRIDERASLRLLQFSTFQMWRDLTDHWRGFMGNPVVRHLVESPGATFDDPAGTADVDVDEAALRLPIAADGSQMQAIRLAERGRSFVLEGPPGTGKSQTITNLIAHAIASGRTVLFVAEKQAALDVVRRRLKQVGLGPFVLDLHGRKQSMKAIRAQLVAAFDHVARDDAASWTALESAYRGRLAPLDDYARRLHEANPAGLTAWSAYAALLAHGDGLTAPIPAAYLASGRQQRDRVELALRDLATVARSAGLRPSHPWSVSGLRTVDGLTQRVLLDRADQMEQLRGRLAGRPDLLSALRHLTTPNEVAGLLPAADLAARRELLDGARVGVVSAPSWEPAVRHLASGLGAFRTRYADELAGFRPEVFTLAELAGWHAEAQSAARRVLGKTKRLMAVAGRLEQYRKGPHPVAADQVVEVLGRLLAAQAEARSLLEQARGAAGVQLPHGWLPTAVDATDSFAAAHRGALVARELAARHPAVFNLFAHGLSADDLRLLHGLAEEWVAWLATLASGAEELGRWCAGKHWLDAWSRDGARWRDDLAGQGLLPLQRWAVLLELADVFALAGLADFRSGLLRGSVDVDAAEQAYFRGLARSSLDERAAAAGFDYFDPDRHDALVAEFQAAAGRLREALPDRLGTTLLAGRPFSPSERRGPAAELSTEVRRKRGGRSFRELFRAYPDQILALTPCVLVSPASAATFLAPDAARFDLVVFDEASQIRVAEAMGAMGRARAAVIVGDSKQMPPTSLMQVSVEDDASGQAPVPEDLDSILSEAVESGLPQRWLSWHYRSRDESLIAFSNRHYYDERLSSLPSPGAARDAGVVWRRVHGTFDRGSSRTNQVEACAIVDEITRRLHDPDLAAQSIGVVTFNVQQRDLILNLLEDSDDPVIREALAPENPDALFVKNLENVQGDERDVVLFSLAFSVNPATGQLPLNFGPLSQSGGERRLNVAVTRARSLVILFASFDPSDIDLSRTSALGTAHLRAYCEAAAARTAGRQHAGPTSGRVERVLGEVAAAIEARGYEVRTRYGLSDFVVDVAVRRPGAGRWQVAVMLDGPEWGRRPTVADRDGSPDLLRSVMGWPAVVRFWLPAWLRDRSLLLDRVDRAMAEIPEEAPPERAAVAEAVSTPLPAERSPAGTTVEAVAPPAVQAADSPTIRATVTQPPPVAVAPTAVTTPVSGAEPSTAWTSVPGPPPPAAPGVGDPFTAFVPRPLGDHADVDALGVDRVVQARMRDLLAEIVAVEGPVESQRLARLALSCFGFAKTTEDRRRAVLRYAASPERHPGMGDFVWPPSLSVQDWRGFRRTSGRGDRAFDEIAPEEVANAVRHAVTRTRRAEEDLLRSAMEALGYRRKTERIDRMLRYALGLALSTGRVTHDRVDGYRAGS